MTIWQNKIDFLTYNSVFIITHVLEQNYWWPLFFFTTRLPHASLQKSFAQQQSGVGRHRVNLRCTRRDFIDIPKMSLRDIFKVTVLMFVMCVIHLCHIGVDCTSQKSLYQKVHFRHGEKIGTIGTVSDRHACLRACDDACGYVQYAANGTCVLYSEALLLTEPATKTGQKVGYRKVILHNSILIYCYD